jgi:hypothetical protein
LAAAPGWQPAPKATVPTPPSVTLMVVVPSAVNELTVTLLP